MQLQPTLMKKACLGLIACLIIQISAAQSIKIAVAANLQTVIKVLGADFNKRSGISIEPIIGSSGNLATQIKNGAPFDVFLSADMAFPKNLYANGFADTPPAVYALGSLIVCSTQNIDIKHWQTLVQTPGITRIAIANPAIAPYGKAATEALTQPGLNNKINNKLVTAESIAQVNTYITTGVVNLGFTTQALIADVANGPKLYWTPVNPKLYHPIQQGMVVLKYGRKHNAQQAEAFYKYLLSAPAKAILKKYGYIVP